MDKWITREWENKQTKHKYSSNQNRFKALRTRGNFKEVYLVRYADDWVLITNSKRNAEVWKWRVSKFLKDRLKLTLSDKKTVITNIRRKAIKFVGFEFKIIRGKSKNGYISRVSPNKERLRKKINEIKKEAHKLRFSKTNLAHHFNLINSKIRGLIEYYTPANTVNVELQNYQHSLHNKALKSLQRRRTRGKNAHKFWELLPANEVDNLRSVHSRYKTKILVIKADNMKIGLTSLAFSKWEMPPLKIKKKHLTLSRVESCIERGQIKSLFSLEQMNYYPPIYQPCLPLIDLVTDITLNISLTEHTHSIETKENAEFAEG